MNTISPRAKSFFFTPSKLAALFVIPAVLHATSSLAEVQVGDTWKTARETGVLRCGAGVSPPYVVLDTKTSQYFGAFSELCKGFAENVLHVKTQFVDTDWSNIIAGLQSNKWDMAMSLSYSAERAKAIKFSAPATNSSVTFTYAKSNPKLKSAPAALADLDRADLTIAVMGGTIADKIITASLKKAKIVRFPGVGETRLALMSKRTDVIADDSGSNLVLVASNPTLEHFSPNPAVDPQPVSFGLRKDTPDADMAVLNQYIEEQVKTGNMDKLMKEAADLTIKLAQ